MLSGKRILRFLSWLGVALLQLIMTQVVTFLLSLLAPGMEDFPQTRSALFVLTLGVAFATGVFVTGWVALRWHWLKTKPKYPARLVGSLVGAYLPLLVAFILYRPLEPGNPFFLVSVLGSVLGFHLPGWFDRE